MGIDACITALVHRYEDWLDRNVEEGPDAEGIAVDIHMPPPGETPGPIPARIRREIEADEGE
ncbi:MAG: hypothetical protein M3304_09020 [Actinomycetota bacterium]|nr:hypothetical protein [Actinomycetota bacterium]